MFTEGISKGVPSSCSQICQLRDYTRLRHRVASGHARHESRMAFRSSGLNAQDVRLPRQGALNYRTLGIWAAAYSRMITGIYGWR